MNQNFDTVKFIFVSGPTVGKRKILKHIGIQPRLTGLYLPIEFNLATLKAAGGKTWKMLCYDSLVSTYEKKPDLKKVLNDLNSQACDRANAIFFMYRQDQPESLEHIKKWFQELKSFLEEWTHFYIVDVSKNSENLVGDKAMEFRNYIQSKNDFHIDQEKKEDFEKILRIALKDCEETYNSLPKDKFMNFAVHDNQADPRPIEQGVKFSRKNVVDEDDAPNPEDEEGSELLDDPTGLIGAKVNEDQVKEYERILAGGKKKEVDIKQAK